ncbi:hypothetical protein [Thalassospira lucentensis]|uniref:Uncharacterized protein n=1 Tax=Thalassospira lucentensis TaxID=168935 RepID=A0A358HN27_9PROT|nr:hypothetical protein [Thalassospira lucentensis]HBU96595.1 hypothetical protein [Thalassospira lucentensis]
MLKSENLKEVVHNKNFARKDIVLIALHCDGGVGKKVSEIRKNLTDAGLRKSSQWNISYILGRLNGLAINTKDGWELTAEGRNAVSKLGIANKRLEADSFALDLRDLINKGIVSEDTKDFVLEAVSCYEIGHWRSAVVLSWIGAVNLLYEFVFQNKLSAFNAEALKRDQKWKTATCVEDFTRLKEFDFLQILTAISVVGKSTKNELEARLKFRNSCGHPNSFKLSERSVSSHLEILILNVYEPFSLSNVVK